MSEFCTFSGENCTIFSQCCFCRLPYTICVSLCVDFKGLNQTKGDEQIAVYYSQRMDY